MTRLFYKQQLLTFLALSFLIFLVIGCNSSKEAVTSTKTKSNSTANVDYLTTETPQQKDQRMAWWRDARFGLFIHWGLYAIPAGEWNGNTNYGEWIRNNAQIPLETYDKFLQQFNPIHFNAEEWVQMAKNAGMKYIVITSKHHDGFSLYNSATADFDVMATPFNRDILKELSEACKKEGIKLCFYHSIMDWHHPDYLPRRNWETTRSAEGADFKRYVSYMKNQLKELVTEYGDIGVLWFDGEWEETWTHEQGLDLYNYVRNLKPDIIINNRVDKGRGGMAGMTREDGLWGGDFGTPEQEIPDTGIPGVDWESCMTMNNNWGYNKNDNNWKSADDLIKKLVDIASKGGNFLLNVGPTAEGHFPQASIERLAAMGEWMKVNGESIYGTQASPFSHLSWGRATQKAMTGDTTRLYLHVFTYPRNGMIKLPGIANTPVRAKLLAASDRNIIVKREEDAITLQLPRQAADPHVTVVALDIVGKPMVFGAPELQPKNDEFINPVSVIVPVAPEGFNYRYTTDGSTPNAQSPVYSEPVQLSASTQIRVKLFKGNQAYGEEANRGFRKVEPLLALPMDKQPKVGLRYRYYEGEWNMLPDFTRLESKAYGECSNFNLKNKKSEEHYGFLFEGMINIPESDIFTFYLASDDGSRLLIDGQPVINNDGPHALQERQISLPLAKGWHRIQLAFFEATGSDELKVQIEGPGMPKKDIPDEWLGH